MIKLTAKMKRAQNKTVSRDIKKRNKLDKYIIVINKQTNIGFVCFAAPTWNLKGKRVPQIIIAEISRSNDWIS